MNPDEESSALLGLLVDYVLPILPPYEFSVYLIVLRMRLREGVDGVVYAGQRSLAKQLGRGNQGGPVSYRHVKRWLENLEAEGFLAMGPTSRRGTQLTVRLPDEVPSVQEQLATRVVNDDAHANFYTDPELRRQCFERDGWRCRYCGDRLDESTATLDHVVPQWRGGPSDDPSNLATACLMCNSIKSGRTLEEVAPTLLERLAARRPGD